jgi:hypothetical protein
VKQQGPLIGVKACVFDAYGMLFDFAAAAKGSGQSDCRARPIEW